MRKYDAFVLRSLREPILHPVVTRQKVTALKIRISIFLILDIRRDIISLEKICDISINLARPGRGMTVAQMNLRWIHSAPEQLSRTQRS
eukprot:1369836-Amorphochlora_amoeboformis.AAC.1